MQVKLISFPHNGNKVQGIKALRTATGLGLKEAKDLVVALQEIDPDIQLVSIVDQNAFKIFKDEGGVTAPLGGILIGQVEATSIAALQTGDYELAIDLIEVLRKHNG